MIKKLLIIFFLGFSTLLCNSRFEGYWMIPSGKTIIKIEKKDEKYIGFVVWLKDFKYPEGDKMYGLEQIDRNNPEPKLRNRKVLGLQVVGDMVLDKDNKNILQGGWVYDSWNGKYYYGEVKLISPNIISLKGSIDKWGILGFSQKCQRVTNIDKYISSGGKRNE